MNFDDEPDLPSDVCEYETHDYEWLTDTPALLAFFEESRKNISAAFQQEEHLEADAAIALYMQMVRAEIHLDGGHLNAAAEFLTAMVERNHLVAVKLTSALAEKHLKKADGQYRNPRNMVKAWHQFHSKELAHLGKIKRREHIGRAFNVGPRTIANWIAEAGPLVAFQDAKLATEIGRQYPPVEQDPIPFGSSLLHP